MAALSKPEGMPPLPTSRESILAQIAAGTYRGFVDDLPAELYHAAPYTSNSALKKAEDSLAKCKAYIDGKLTVSETASQRLGTLCHMRTLEPERFARTVKSFESFRKKVDQEARDALEAAGGYACLVSEYDRACRMSDALLKHPKFGGLLKGGFSERSCFWTDPETGVAMKCRLDKIHPEAGVILDVKYFDDLNDYPLQKQMRRMRYDWQQDIYTTGAELTHGIDVKVFANLFVQDDEPFGTRCVYIGPESRARAAEEVRHHLVRVAYAQKTGEWLGYPDTFDEIELTPW